MAKRTGNTEKVSLSVNREDLAVLKRRAKRLHGGNVSAVFAELIAELKQREAWERAVAWYGEPIRLTGEEQTTIDRELLGPAPATSSRRVRRA